MSGCSLRSQGAKAWALATAGPAFAIVAMLKKV